MIKLNIKNKSTIFHSCTCTLYIYMWIKSMEHLVGNWTRTCRAVMVRTRSIYSDEKALFEKKCTCVVHRGFPNDWLATSSSDRNLQVKIPGENPRWVFFSHGMLEFHGFRSLLIRLTYARVQVIDTCTCIHPCIESSFRKHMLPTSSAKGIWFPFFIALKMHFYEKYWHSYTI